jgi:hypothetical protein
VILIGIDPGVHTGIGVWRTEPVADLTVVDTRKIHQAMALVRELMPQLVIVEDARQRTWFGGADARQRRSGAGIREGIGSVKRDCTIWEDFLRDLGIPCRMQHPARSATKRTPAWFASVTGWEGRTSEHARDAAMLVHGMDAARAAVLIAAAVAPRPVRHGPPPSAPTAAGTFRGAPWDPRPPRRRRALIRRP